jgi:hypothetical protein
LMWPCSPQVTNRKCCCVCGTVSGLSTSISIDARTFSTAGAGAGACGFVTSAAMRGDRSASTARPLQVCVGISVVAGGLNLYAMSCYDITTNILGDGDKYLVRSCYLSLRSLLCTVCCWSSFCISEECRVLFSTIYYPLPGRLHLGLVLFF